MIALDRNRVPRDVARGGQAFLERINEWIAAHAVEASDDPGSGVRLRVGIYQIQTPKLIERMKAGVATPHPGEPR